MKTNKILLSLTVLTLPLLAVGQAKKEATPVVTGKDIATVPTESGKVKGYIHNGIFTFKGIPYAKAERFMASRVGGKVTSLMNAPSAKGLFHKAIVQSGRFSMVLFCHINLPGLPLKSCRKTFRCWLVTQKRSSVRSIRGTGHQLWTTPKPA